MGRTLSRPLRVSGRPISNFPQFLNKGALKAYRISRSRKRLVAATRSAPALNAGDNQRPQSSGRVIPLAESFVPAKTWPWGGGEDKVCGCRLNPSLISEVLPSLAARCISQSGSVLRRLYLRPQPHTTTIFPRDERLIYTSHHPVRWPYRRRPHLLN